MPLWHNSSLNIEYRQNWETQGISILSDVLDNNGDIITMTEMNAKNLKIHFLDYLKLQQSVKKLNINKEKYSKFEGHNCPE